MEIKLSVEQMSITAARDNETIVYDLSNDFGYSKRLVDLDRAIESKRRALNPDNYDENGVPKKGKRAWMQDSAYKKLLDQKRYIWHKVKKARKNRFGRIANQILMLGDTFTLYQEDSNPCNPVRIITQKRCLGLTSVNKKALKLCLMLHMNLWLF